MYVLVICLGENRLAACLHAFVHPVTPDAFAAETAVLANDLHPGWVQTDMGRAAEGKLGAKAPLDPETSIAGQHKVILGITRDQNGQYVDYQASATLHLLVATSASTTQSWLCCSVVFALPTTETLNLMQGKKMDY